MLEEFLSDEVRLKTIATGIALLIFLIMLKRINKVLLFVGVLVIAALYLMQTQPPWFRAIIVHFQI